MIPLQALGVVDVGATYVGESEVVTNAMVNAVNSGAEKGYTVKWSSEFVNEYARVDTFCKQRTDGGTENLNHMMGAYPNLWPYTMGGIETN